MSKKEELLLKVIEAKGFSHEDTIWFCKFLDSTDDLNLIMIALQLALYDKEPYSDYVF